MSNILNRLSYDIRRLFKRIVKLENRVDDFENKAISVQLIENKSSTLEFLTDILGYVYGIDDSKVFDVNVNTNSNSKIMYINVSASFIVESSEMDIGSVLLKLKINGQLMVQNETSISNKGYNNVSLNYTQEIEGNSLYNIEIVFEGNIVSNNILGENPILHIKNNGALFSTIVI